MADSRYRAFVSAAKLGSLTKAADFLGYTQSGVSHLVKALEDELGITLLLRSRSGTILTEEGKKLFPYIQSLLLASDTVESVVNEMKGLQTGSVRIGTFSSVTIHYLPSILSAYTTLYPNIETTVVNGNYSVLEAALLDNNIDCSFVTMPSLSMFKSYPLCEDRLLAVFPAAHPLASREELAAAELLNEQFILPAEGANYDIGKLFQAIGAVPSARFNMEDDYSALEMVRHGIGITILPELLLSQMPTHGIRTVPIQGTVRKVGIAINRNRSIPPAVRAFIECVRNTIQGEKAH